MKEIPLTQGKVTVVDDCDYEELSKYKWFALKNGNTFYAARNSPRDCNGKQHTTAMHRVIMKTPNGMETDHIDGNGLNNTKENLRVCTHSENMRNAGRHAHNTSGLKGVSYYKRYGKWRSSIHVGGIQKTLGYYATALEAYRAYCASAQMYHGEFANVT